MTISLFAAVASLVSAQPTYGVAVAGDGDSLTIGARRFRLFGIDAPEFDQRCMRGGNTWSCGQIAADQLSKLVTGREVRCIPTGTDDFDRTVARCTVGATDVNRTMVALGYAVAFRKYSLDFVSAEDEARKAKRGIWSGSFEMPVDVRAASRQGAKPRQIERRAPITRPQTPGWTGECVIKGNHSRRGGLIYHLPGMPYYGPTRAEAMFCSEAQAQRAGYRRARVR